MFRRCLLACLLPATVLAQGINNLPVVDAPPIGGRAVNDLAGAAVLLEGDFNGDGIADVVVSAPNADSSDGARANVGKVYVTYGTPDGPSIISDPNAPLPGEGFVLEGHRANFFLGETLTAADLNGDGIDDLVAGAPRSSDFAGAFSGPNLGVVVVLFGQRDPLPVNTNAAELVADVDTNTGRGFVMDGALPNGRAGADLDAAGDLNGDGIEDLLIGSENGGSGFGGSTRPTAFLLLGRSGAEAWPGIFKLVSLRPGVTDGSLGTYVQGDETTDLLGRAVVSLGDITGDGLNDFAVGAPLAAYNGEESGAAYIIAGKTIYPNGVDLNTIEPDALLMRIVGRPGEQFGTTLGAPGDMNGDGRPDLAIGSAATNENAGRVDVIYLPASLPSEIQMTDGFDGFSLTGEAGERLGSDLARAGDLDGDGFADLFVGSRDHPDGGRARVIYGSAGRSGTRSVDDAPDIGFIAAQGSADSLGRSVSGGADLNADGSNDIVAGAPLHDPGIDNAGIAYRFLGAGDDAAPPMRGGLSHAWYDRLAPGQGLLLEYGLRNGRPGLFGAWYTFTGGEPLWLVTDLIELPGTGRSVTTDLFRTRGGQFGPDFDPGDVTIQPWGSVRITQTGCGRLLWEFDGADGEGRLVFVPVLPDLLAQPLCTEAGDDPDADALRSKTVGTWWNPLRGGEGVIIDVEARTETPELFFSWFTFFDGEPVWLVGNGAIDPDSLRTVTIDVFSARGARFGDAFDPSSVTLEPRGTVTLDFLACDAAELSYAVDPGAGPVTGTIDLERFTGGLSALACTEGS